MSTSDTEIPLPPPATEPDPQPEVEEPLSPRLGRLEWLAFVISALAAFAVYSYTLAPTVTLEDSGELAVAADYLGVPHPPGYPIWTVISWIFTKIFAFVPYRGFPNPAWAVALVSAFFGALAAGTAAMLVTISGKHILQRFALTKGLDRRMCHQIAWLSGVTASLIFAFSPVMWSQSVIVEVYSLNAFFLILICLLLYLWMCKPSNSMLYWIAFIFGLGLTNYQVLLLFGVALAVAIMFRNKSLFLVFALTGAVFALTYFAFKSGYLPFLEFKHPTEGTFYTIILLNFAFLLVVYAFAPYGKTVAITILMAELGVAFYLFMPIASETNPPMNWAYPRTFEGFMHAVSRGQYEQIKAADPRTFKFLLQTGVYLGDVRTTFSIPLAILAAIPFTVWRVRLRSVFKIRLFYPALALLGGSIALVVLDKAIAISAGSGSAHIRATYLVLLMALGGIAFLGLIVCTKSLVLSLWSQYKDKSVWMLNRLTAIGVLSAMSILGLILYYIVFEIIRDPATPTFIRLGLLLVLACPIFIGVIVSIYKDDLELEMDITSEIQEWLLTTLSGFFLLSLFLIALANLKLDIQDYFIQRVKFISSHGLFIIWIGYGLLLTLAAVGTFVKRIEKQLKSSLVSGLYFYALLLVPVIGSLIPIYQNYHNEDNVHISGGAEQNGHDFGWQFGYYQLQGSRGIEEELTFDEEPLPNPEYPPMMGTNAIFFGGTDPGRFVPTYMIYSAKARHDVFLITQNALADNTYMNVMRDLYGDDIWIPSIPDSNKAFSQYLDDVKMKRRPASAEIRIEGGRVQVMGVGGVMIINGYLAKMIFDNNIDRHDFYVEESYVLPWMYEYMSPHGLILKINKEKLNGGRPGLPERNVRNDLDFWDWYSRRLLANPKFNRDVVARKSFSKLRGAIAGVYSDHSRRLGFRKYIREAEYAFAQSLELYPLSPEANFRYAELQVKQGKFEQARAIMVAFKEKDKGNEKIDSFIKQLDNMQSRHGRMAQLQQEMRNNPGGRIDIQKALELATIYKDMKQQSQFMALTDTILKNTNLPHQVFMNLAQLYAQVGAFQQMTKALEIYLTKVPTDINAMIDLSALYVMQRNVNGAMPLIDKAIKVGGPSVRQRLMQDQRFASLRNNQLFLKLLGASPSPAPGFNPQARPGAIPGATIPSFPGAQPSQPSGNQPGATPPTALPSRPPTALPIQPSQ